MKVQELIAKLQEYNPTVDVAVVEQFEDFVMYSGNFDFEMKRFDLGPGERPFHKLVILVTAEPGISAFQMYKDFKDGATPDDLIDELNGE